MLIEHITELQALAQTGLAFTKDKFDLLRYQRILEISAQILALNSNHRYEDVLERFKAGRGYATPRIDVRGAIIQNDSILLVQEKCDELWALPGGFADVNFSASENVIKEIKEETGFQSRVLQLIAVLDKRKHSTKNTKWPHVYKLFFLCELTSTEQEAFDPNEILNVDFFKRDHLPPLSIERTNQHYVDICFKHHDSPSLPTECD